MRMDMHISIKDWEWTEVFRIPQGTLIQKGRRGIYYEIIRAAGDIKERFGCYAWGSRDKIYYCGSHARDYQRKFHENNFQQRVHNYLQNHRVKKGRTNTNKWIFDKIKEHLGFEDIYLFYLRFKEIEIDKEIIHFKDFSEMAELVRAVEELMIAHYKKIRLVEWNRK